MSWAAMRSWWSVECIDRSVSLGKYWRSGPLVFSLEPGCGWFLPMITSLIKKQQGLACWWHPGGRGEGRREARGAAVGAGVAFPWRAARGHGRGRGVAGRA